MSKPNVHGLPPHLRKDDGGYYLDYFVQVDGKKNRKRIRLGDIPVAQAKRVLAQHMVAIVDQQYLGASKPRVTFNQAAEAFLEYSKSRKESFKQDQFYVRNLKAYFGEKPLETLNLDMVEGYINWRKTDGNRCGRELSSVTLNRDLVCLKTLVRRAVSNRLIDRNPIQGLKLFKEIPRNRTITQSEFQRLVECCPVHLKPIVSLAYYTGMRKKEILGLIWDKVDFPNKVITLEATDTKTQEKREIPLDETLVVVLERVPKTLGCPFVFNYKGENLKHSKNGFKAACQLAGLDGFHFHDLRHCAVTNMRKAGVPESVIMSISGHKTNSVFRRYDRIDRTDRLEALDRVRKFNDTHMTTQVNEQRSVAG